ncbi:DivIVA domain-containing protein [Mycobacterium decipiens]|uniref:Cell division protein DivIVA n=1 Tax=Mycobacterium decipiens TaxID=1430326 RepID=A0A1X2LZJ1_9MYCO|nr:DivIVA domain-containing protein [Mycobacterium decipiens]OSC42717.1 hypothetical protein B8W66_04070 [Mycobacterium decipiens]
MATEVPNFETQLRGYDRAQVTEYIRCIHSEVESRREHIRILETDRERAAAEVSQLRGEIERLSGPIDSVEGMSDRIARMMHVASDEARRIKSIAREEADALTHELRDEIEAARQNRAAANAALDEFQRDSAARREQILAEAKAEASELLTEARRDRAAASAALEEFQRGTAARRDQILADAKAEAEELLRTATNERDRLAEEFERRRSEEQSRLDQQIKSNWEQAEAHIANLKKDSRLKAAELITTAERNAQLISERTEAQVKELIRVRGEVLAALSEIQSRIETAVRRDRISIIKTPAESEEAQA